MRKHDSTSLRFVLPEVRTHGTPAPDPAATPSSTTLAADEMDAQIARQRSCLSRYAGSIPHPRGSNIFFGELDAEGRRHGRGVYLRRYLLPPERQCEVRYHHGKMVEIVQWSATGWRLEKNSRSATGHGRLFYQDADLPTYEGSLRDGVPNGHGVERGPSGTRYIGGMRNGLYHGLGSLWDPVDDTRKTGRFEQGNFVARVTASAPAEHRQM